MNIQRPEEFKDSEIAKKVGEKRDPMEGTKNNAFITRQADKESNARTYAKNFKIAMDQARGIYVKDVDGNLYFDCLCGAGALGLGHNHPVVKEAILAVINNDTPLLTLDITTPIKDKFVEYLFSVLPKEFAKDAKIQFCGPTGADGIEAALKLVKIATGRAGIMAFSGGFHGQTHGALALMGNTNTKSSVPGLMPNVNFLPYPYQYRNPMGKSGAEDCDKACINYIENLLSDDESGIVKPAAIVMEAVQGEGGVIPASDFFMQEIRRITQEQDIVLIIDEVQAGIGRTGKIFAFEHSGITPDVVVLSKAIGGSLPLSVVLYNKKLDVWKPGAHTGTFRGNQLALAAGHATLKFIKENNLPERAMELGKIFKANFEKMQKTLKSIGDIRIRGLMIGIELINANLPTNRLGHPVGFPDLAKKMREECLKRGLIVELGGRRSSVVRMFPPLIITEDQIKQVCAIFAESLTAAEAEIIPEHIAAS